MGSSELVALGVCMSYRKACLTLLVVIPFTAVLAQVSHSEQVQIAPPLIRAIDPPAPDATAADLEQQGDALHSAKLYLDALDYYRAALVKMPSNAPVLNKMCRTELLMNRWKDARKTCERAIKVNHAFAEAYGNLAVAYYGDKKYGAAWRETIHDDRASASKELKRPAIFSELEQYAAAHPQPMANRETPHTTHYSVVDAEGNAVAVTTTLNDAFGSRVTAEGLGFLLNDEMDDFSAKPGVPNSDGLIQGPANAIGPGKRPLSSMTPTIVVREGKTYLVLGSPGSSKIITTVANVLMGVVDYGMNIQEAVNAPRFHNQWLPDVLNVEQWFSPDTVHALQKMGYNVEVGLHDGAAVSPYWSDAECVAIDAKTGERLGASDGRSNGKAVGY